MHTQSELTISYTLVDSPRLLSAAVAELRAGSGLFAVDAERASGFRYYNRAYLVQITREEIAGRPVTPEANNHVWLIDPTTCGDLHELAELMGEAGWILHSAKSDLPGLRELGLSAPSLVDTELAARLLNLPRVGLGALTEHYCQIELEKAHAAADWSKRPLPEAWLEYAAFDAAVLPSLWRQISADLKTAEKYNLAQQEFTHLLTQPEPRRHAKDPWRRLSGIHQLGKPQSLAVARELWLARDELARSLDISPGRLLPDRSIVLAARQLPRSARQLAANKEFHGRASRSELQRWWRAIERGTTSAEKPARSQKDPHTPPQVRSWEEKRPEAAQRLGRARPAIAAQAESLNMPVENLLAPDVLRRICWEPPQMISEDAVAARLAELGARDWQIAQTRQILTQVFSEYPQT